MLSWPEESIETTSSSASQWRHSGTNNVLDFHGDPRTAELVVFSDGNHHMALLDALNTFAESHPELGGVFYATTPPAPIIELLEEGSLQLGNLVLSVKPHVFLSPPAVLDRLVAAGHMVGHAPFMRNRGSVLLVRANNPKKIRHVNDLHNDDIRLFVSNPKTERVSYQGYRDTLDALGKAQGLTADQVTETGTARIIYGECIHHREAPQALADDRVDAAIVYYHLALRYTRIFPGQFEIVPLGGSAAHPDPLPGNVIGLTHLGLIGKGGAWGARLKRFLLSESVAEIYRSHGLLPAQPAETGKKNAPEGAPELRRKDLRVTKI